MITERIEYIDFNTQSVLIKICEEMGITYSKGHTIVQRGKCRAFSFYGVTVVNNEEFKYAVEHSKVGAPFGSKNHLKKKD